MSRRSLSDLSDPALRHALKTKAGCERTATADLVAHIAEFDARKLYLADGYSSMFAYCVAELLLSPDAAARRIQAARVVQRFPVVLDTLDDGRLNLTAVGLLSPHLTENNAKELLAAALGRTKVEIAQFLAARFPRSEMLTWVAEMPASLAPCSDDQHALAHVEDQGSPDALAPEGVEIEPNHALARLGRSRVKPLSAESFDVQFTMDRGAHDKLRYAQELLSHQIASGDLARVFERALDALIPQLEKAKFAAINRPPQCRPRSTPSPRNIPAQVMREVWQRDGGQCTFVSESGHRCRARRLVEFDHVTEVARGGEATVEGIRLRCRAHNQYGAECTFGAEFMHNKRIAAAEARAKAKAQAALARAEAARAEQAAAAELTASEAAVLEVVPCLRQLGYSASEARGAAGLCREMLDATLEERVRVALTYFRLRGTKMVRADASEPALAAAS